MRMTDARKLDSWVKEHGYKFSYIAERLGISEEGLRKKRRGISEFKPSEIAIFMRLGMTAAERKEIFLI